MLNKEDGPISFDRSVRWRTLKVATICRQWRSGRNDFDPKADEQIAIRGEARMGVDDLSLARKIGNEPVGIWPRSAFVGDGGFPMGTRGAGTLFP